MITVGSRPILWHIMKWYASWGHDDFVLCLGYKAEVIKEYFLSYNEALSNDFVLSNGGKTSSCSGSDISNWRITFADTGTQSTIGERLARGRAASRRRRVLPRDVRRRAHRRAAARHDRAAAGVGQDRAVHLGAPDVQRARRRRPTTTGVVRSVEDIQQADVWINGGFFVFRRDVLDYINPGEELVDEPFQRLIEEGELIAYRYEGFWEPMDTIKDKQRLDALAECGQRSLAPAAGLDVGAAAPECSSFPLSGGARAARAAILALGCHADDIEIGCGATLLALTRARPDVEVTWVVLGADGRARATRRAPSADAFLAEAATSERRACTGSATASSRTSAARSRTSSRS